MAVGLEHLWVFEATTEALKQQLAVLHNDASHYARWIIDAVQEELAARDCDEAIRQLLTEEEEWDQQSSLPSRGLEPLSSCEPGGTGSLHCTPALQCAHSPVHHPPCNTSTEPQQVLLQQESVVGQVTQGSDAVPQITVQHVLHTEQHQSVPSCIEQSRKDNQQAPEQQWPKLTPLQAAQLAFEEEQARIRRARQAVVRRPRLHGRPVTKQLSCAASEKAIRQSKHWQQLQHVQQHSHGKGTHSGAATQVQRQQHQRPEAESVHLQQRHRQQQPEIVHAGQEQQGGQQVSLLQHVPAEQQEQMQGHGELLSSACAGPGLGSAPVGLQAQKLSQLRQLACSHHHGPMTTLVNKATDPATAQTAPPAALYAATTAELTVGSNPGGPEGQAAVANDAADSMVVTAQLCSPACCTAGHNSESGCKGQTHIGAGDCQPIAVDVRVASSQSQIPTTSCHSPVSSTDHKQLQLEHQKYAPESHAAPCPESCSAAACASQGDASGHCNITSKQEQLLAAEQEYTQQQAQVPGLDQGLLHKDEVAPSFPDAALSVEPPQEKLLSAALASAELLSSPAKHSVGVFESEAEPVAASQPDQPGGVYNRLTGRAGIHQPLQQDCWKDWDVMAGSLQDTADGFGAWAATHDL